MSTSPAKQSALTELKQTLASWGLSSLYSDAVGFLNQGLNEQEIELKLQTTKAYETRFSGNAIRVANGYAALSPADYISTENSYKQIMQQYGLPAGFYDKPSDLADFIGKDISASELDTRASVAAQQYQDAPADVKSLWQSYYGYSAGDAIASILDPKVALQTIQNRSTQVSIGTAAQQQGINIGQSNAAMLQQQGVTADQAESGFQTIGQNQGTDSDIASRFGTTFGLSDEENANLLGQGAAVNKLRTLYGDEKSLFNTSSGASANSLGVGQTNY